MKKLIMTAMFAVPAALSLAQLSSVGPFTGSMSEGFESFTNSQIAGHYQTMSIFGGGGTLNSVPMNAEHMYVYEPGAGATWGLGGLGSAGVNSGAKAVGFEDISANPSGDQNGEILFASPVDSFGGYFALEASSPAFLQFFDSAGMQIGTDQQLMSATNVLQWQGWSSTVGISRIEIVSRDNYLAMDDLQANTSTVPEPASLAVLGLGAIALIRRRKSA
ncbi:MAG: PEP-CTERM sorting domain-containing protein [Armatimonadetes bacterium]|nr:PEP-CTERM sorting domain-containing protein [Armatimonadota bacterium]MBS1701372.1 PEP-CTERM sorting domain-containing protein [Armatimonadota bacterium]MBS1728383.1 PEP-CTERM sorting domain-containing protein [Armatimonadota bacterium]